MINADSVVVVDEITTASKDYKIGRLTLNKPKALNALDLEMAGIMLDALRQWQARSDIVAVVIDAAGEKAFCAGGDIVSMYNSMVEAHGEIPAFLETFFETEYTLDYTIHNYNKPIIVWSSGIVMGGGMGLLCGASHRVVTENSRLAMPEISIGLYPDVGGSYFLPRLPGKSGLFLGLTGGQMNAADAMYVGLADVMVSSAEKENLLQGLVDYAWNETSSSTLAEAVNTVLSRLQKPETEVQSNIGPNMPLINDLCSANNVSEVVNAILTADMQGDKWLSRAQSTLAKGSPITMHLVFEQCKKGATMSLADCFRMEADMSCRCGESGEFQEGVRALLIDKDMTPQWKFKKVEDVPEAEIAHFFTSPWSKEAHPLAAL
ncbi:enoyl-CoA hydratase [Alteromonas mediterranea]|uniref:3-hydroxyisobutyryl-CoA hydrolase n=1 Tax=Alteromonas mediterranea TaxID=314275 RepID=A0AAC9NRU1_9ALTE|nr:enoyl-CoA hydratase/isomerase family protein [Alteromonas mediterranea]APD89929.1 enoyl-CoA hydratase [Alteromonas mediterranea]